MGERPKQEREIERERRTKGERLRERCDEEGKQPSLPPPAPCRQGRKRLLFSYRLDRVCMHSFEKDIASRAFNVSNQRGRRREEKQRERERQRDRQTVRQRGREAERQRDRQRQRERGREKDFTRRARESERERERDRQSERGPSSKGETSDGITLCIRVTGLVCLVLVLHAAAVVKPWR